MTPPETVLYRLAVALAIGLLIGLERGWKAREVAEGQRVAGLRTHGLVGLLGGVSALLAEALGAMVFGFAFLGLAAFLGAVYLALRARQEDVGITSEIATLLVFALGALAVAGQEVIAGAAAVVTTLLLTYKPTLHRWVGRLEGEEFRAGIKLLLLSVVILPLVPDRGFGPWEALNLRTIWWMVVLVAAISFVGYVAVKAAGPRRGAAFTGLFGGLASSTSVTLGLARLARRTPTLAPELAAGVLLACGTMLPRMLVVAAIVDPRLLAPLAPPAAAMAACVYGPALLGLRRTRPAPTEAPPLGNPLELKAALGFGALLALVMLLGEGLKRWLGGQGVLALAAASGVADVDAITLSLSRMHRGDLETGLVVTGIVVAASVNSLTKAGMAMGIGGRALGFRVLWPLLASAVAGPVTVLLLHA